MDIRKYFHSRRNVLGGNRKIEGAPSRNSRSSSPEPVMRRSSSPVSEIKETTFDVPFEYEDFIKERNLGVGAFGSVSMVKDKRTGEKYALKYYKSNENDGLSSGIAGSFIDSFGGNRQEVDFLQRVDHPNIIRGLGAILTSNDAIVKNNAKLIRVINLGVVMELADTSLTAFIKNNYLSNKGILSLCYNILCGLNFIHENGYIHCDLKPDNILVKNFVAKIADPGYLINKNSVGNVMLTTNFCNPLLTRAPEIIGLHPLRKNERL